MPFTSERKNLIRNLELMIVDAFNDSDDETVEELVELHDFITISRFVNERTLRVQDDHFFRQKFERLMDDEFRSTFRTTRRGFKAWWDSSRDIQSFRIGRLASNWPQHGKLLSLWPVSVVQVTDHLL